MSAERPTWVKLVAGNFRRHGQRATHQLRLTSGINVTHALTGELSEGSRHDLWMRA
jgi:hypothetical protein